ncbi:SMP-30/gluconolactonase/LRE family protein [Streptacidiphilus sp. MAP5-3]|uniref:SMP-30/gluconolactonase/LRE family protein n=1 Tax=unclassified Streptacidiphilus TaxID=2643834 RepID=UPI0035132059
MPLEHADVTPLALGEGALWDAATGRVYWIGVEDRTLRWLSHADGSVGEIALPTMPGTVAPYRDGTVLLAVAEGFALLDTATGTLRTVAEVETDRPDRRMNDGKCDPFGRIVAGTMQVDEPRRPGPLYRLEPDAADRSGVPGIPGVTAVPIADGFLIPNGLDWPEPDLLWHTDTPRRRIDLYAYPEHGPLATPLRSLDLSHLGGDPDGMTLDAEGNLWIAFWGGGVVRCLSPQGRLLETVELPVPNVTSCAFGGPELDTLYVTTAGGGLFRQSGLGRGRPANAWSGFARPGE